MYVKIIGITYILSMLLFGKVYTRIESVEINGYEIPVMQMNGLQVPDINGVIGLIRGYPAKVFVAHDYFSGIYFMNIRDLFLIYSNGVKVEYEIVDKYLVEMHTYTSQVYYSNDLVFQTCYGNMILIIKANRKR
jgi:hypothetical protein